MQRPSFRMETFLMVRRKKSTMFLMCSEGDTIGLVKRKLAAILREDAGAIGLFQDKDGAMVEAADADQTVGGLGLAGTPQSPACLVAAVAGETPEVTLYVPCTMHHAPGDALLCAARPARGDEAPAG